MNKRTILVFLVVALFCVIVVIGTIIDRWIPKDPSDVGNSAGNLHNNGLFFEMDGKVYFANPYDYNCLYSMNPDETNPKRLTSMRVQYISGANGFLYFYMDSTGKSSSVAGLGSVSNQYGIYRCKVNGSDQTCLLRDFVDEVQLCGEYLYYTTKLDGGALNKIRVDKKNKTQVAAEPISPVCYDRGIIYFTGVSEDHYIHTLDTKNGDRISDFLPGHLFYPVVNGNYIYYMNGDSNYSLWRSNLYSGESELITSDRLDFFTMDNNHIYYAYAGGDKSALKMCDLDGSYNTVLFEGVTNNLNVTSHYLYFKVYGEDQVVYHMPLDGTNRISVLSFD
ncbi:DUF5050 domain-containing protein [Butyrivibrio sp. VCB2006]|uniref:DUF5050 domain-containing protein n=1 Tax=Butyrivibrio sp. VCB2006 TaxID=1280679 RepID=UPI0004926A9C|nr:DUF5050 domain-containing protein [Butyrivibrio sp. VCB2006]